MRRVMSRIFFFVFVSFFIFHISSFCFAANWCWTGGGTDPFPWGGGNAPEGSWGANTMQRMIEARAVFPALRRSPYNGGRFGFSGGNLDTDILAYHRKATEQAIGPRILVLVNRSASAQDVSVNVTADGAVNGDVYEDYMVSNFGETVSSRATVSNGNLGIRIDQKNVRLMVQGGYSTSTLTGVVTNLPSGQKAVVDVDGISVWTRDSDTSGNFTINRIVTPDAGSVTRTVHIWAPGKGLLTQTATFTNNTTNNLGNITLPSAWSPQAPVGFGGRARDRAVDLWWTNRTEPEAASYHIYWSSKSGGPYAWAGEFLQSPIYYSGAQDITGNKISQQRKFDTFLTNNQTYYFIVRTANRDGTKSPASPEITLIPHKVKVRFWLDARGISNPSGKAWIRGNTKELGPGLNDAEIGLPTIVLKEMTANGDGTFEITVEMDPTLYIRYKYTIDTSGGFEGLGTYTEIGQSGGTYQRSTDRGSPRGGNTFFEIRDEGDGTMLVVNKWANIGDESNWGSVAPAAPTGLSLAASSQTLKLGWKKNLEPDIIQYQIDRDGVQIAVTDGNTFQLRDSGLTNGTTYTYRMRAVNRYGKTSANSSTVSGFPTPADVTAPIAPSGLNTFAASTASVRITWNVSPEADLAGYNIYRSTTSNDASPTKQNTALVSPSLSPLWDDATVTVGVTYYYRLEAQDDSNPPNISTKSAQVSAFFVIRTFRVDMGSAAATSISITGQPLPFTSAISMTQESNSPNTWTALTGQIAGKAMRYRYKAVIGTNTFTEGNFSTNSGDREITISFQTNQTITDDWEETPEFPANVRGYADDASAWIYWDAATGSEDVAGYKIYSSTGGLFSPLVAASPYRVTGLTNGQSYNFVVRSVDGGEIVLESANSATVTVTPEASINVIIKGDRRDDRNYEGEEWVIR